MTRKQIVQWLTWLAWGLFFLAVGIILITPADMSLGSVALTLLYGLGLIGILAFAGTWLIVVHRVFFASWIGWSLSMAGFLCIQYLSVNPWLGEQSSIRVLFILLQASSMVWVGVTTGILLWYRDVSVMLIGLLSIAYVFSLSVAWQWYGNLVELWLLALESPEIGYVFWWLNSIQCISCWIIPLATLSFIGHTLRIVTKELLSEPITSRPDPHTTDVNPADNAQQNVPASNDE